jgi:hypothetical protein
MTNKILGALLKLDVQNNNHWTADGLPRLDTVRMLASDQTLTREQVAVAAPGFSRATATGYTAPSAEQQAPQMQSPQGSTEQQQSAAPAAPHAAPSTEQGPSSLGKPDDIDAGQAQQPTMEAVGTGATDEILALQAELAEQEELVREIRRHKAKVDAEFDKARKREDELRMKLESLRPNDNTTHAIQDYLASQRKVLEQRAARQQMIKDSGISLKELASGLRSPLDSAMARRTGRGNQRPGS